MAEELTPADVSSYNPELTDVDENTRLLAAALQRIRTFCGWHVSPVEPAEWAVHGRNFDFIVVPTLKIVDIISITEDGVPVDLTNVVQYSDEPGVLYKKSGIWHGRVEIEATHGFTAAEAMDWREEVLALIDRQIINIGTGGNGPLSGLEVDDVSMRWSGITDRSWGIAKQPLNESVLYQYRILPIA